MSDLLSEEWQRLADSEFDHDAEAARAHYRHLIPEQRDGSEPRTRDASVAEAAGVDPG